MQITNKIILIVLISINTYANDMNTTISLKQSIINIINKIPLKDEVKNIHLDNLKNIKTAQEKEFIDNLYKYYIDNNISHEYRLGIHDNKPSNLNKKSQIIKHIGGVFCNFDKKTKTTRFYACASGSICEKGKVYIEKDNDKYEFLSKIYKQPFANDTILKVKLFDDKSEKYFTKKEDIYDLFMDKNISKNWNYLNLYFKDYTYKINLKEKDVSMYFMSKYIPLSYVKKDENRIVSVFMNSIHNKVSQNLNRTLLKLDKMLINNEIDKIIIDLTSNYGGNFKESLKLAVPFLKDTKADEKLFYVNERYYFKKNKGVEVYKKNDFYNRWNDMKLEVGYKMISPKNTIIKVSSITSGGAEIFAGILQQKLGYKIISDDNNTAQYQVLKIIHPIKENMNDYHYMLIIPIGVYYIDELKKDLINQQEIN